MLNKLILRNAKRSMKDYMIYMITMGAVAAFMYAFDALLFSDIVQNMWETAMTMAVMIGLVTVFIMFIVAWLINYMVRFMLEKRSREFGTYLLLGMKKSQVSSIYMRENLLLGMISLVAGIFAGTLLQQIVMLVFFQLFSRDYQITVSFSPWCLLLTVGCYMMCYLLALWRNRRLFRRMNISELMAMEQTGEAAGTRYENWKQFLFFAAIVYFIVFFCYLFRGSYQVSGVIFAVIGFIAAIYMFYQGLAAFLVCYIRGGGRLVYRRDGLFLFRQLSSKLRTMRFTMGTLTFLFTGALLGATVSMMFASYQKEAINNMMPADIFIYSQEAEDDFSGERALIAEETEVLAERIYPIYQNEKSHEMNDYLYAHISNFNGMFLKADGSLDREKIKEDDYNPYHDYDTYLSLSDYNALRKIMGYDEVELNADEYLIHIKNRLLRDIEQERLEQELIIGSRNYRFSQTKTEAFSQNGMNGADYIFVVPDAACAGLTPYYAMLVADIEGKAPADLQVQLEECYYHSRGFLTEAEAIEKAEALEEQEASQEKIVAAEHEGDAKITGCGSDEILTLGSYDVAVRDNLSDGFLGIVSSVTFPLAYIALIFVCVAFTILAVQQLSDSNRYRYRYDVLRKMGVNEKELNMLIFKQLSMYYLIPVLMSLILSGVIGIFAGERFVFYTDASSNALSYYGISVFTFAGVYLLYFASTYLRFRRNVEQVFVRME